MAVSPDQDGTDTITQPTPQYRSQPNDLKQQQHQQQPKPTPKTETIRSLALLSLALFDTYILPPQSRTAILQTVVAHPLLSSFLLAQLLCSTIPLLLFAIGIMTAGIVAAAVFAWAAAYRVIRIMTLWNCSIAGTFVVIAGLQTFIATGP